MKATLSSLIVWAIFSLAPCDSIIRGTKAATGRFPYYVSLVNSAGIHRCGGTLIAPDIVMTAAVCSARDFTQARIGARNMATVETIAIQEAYIDPSWDAQDGSFDIMLLKLERSSSAQWVRVNSNAAFPAVSSGVEIEALGIGRTTRTSRLATDLQIKSMLIVSPNSCNALIKTGNSTGAFKTLTNSHMCVKDYRFNGGQCLGDEGGPLVQVGNALRNDVLVGVMSRVSGTCASSSPTYPTRGTITARAFSFIAGVICSASNAPPPYARCGASPTRRPTTPALRA